MAKIRNSRYQIAVIGSAGPEEYPQSKPRKEMYDTAENIGWRLAQAGYITVTGGKGGVMEAVSRGASKAGGTTVAEIAGSNRFTANIYTDVEIVSYDDGYRGPSLLVGMSDVVIALGGGAGTLQELVVAYRLKKPIILVVGYGGWTDRLSKLRYLDERQLIAFNTTNKPADAVTLVASLLQ